MRWMQKSAAFVAALALMVVLFSGCSRGDEAGEGLTRDDYPVTIGSVRIERQPQKVAVLSPSLADVVLSIKSEIQLAARTEQCAQQELAVLPVVGSENGIDAAAVKELGCDFVLTDVALDEATTTAMAEAGIPVLVQQAATTREEFETLYKNVGSALGGGQTGAAKAQKRAQSLLKMLDDISREIPKSDTVVTACYLYDTQGAAVTGDTLGGKLFEYAGAVNAVSDSTGGRIDLEALRLGDPTYLFCAPGVKEQLQSDEVLSQLTAVQQGRVYEMAPGLIEWQGDSVLDGVVYMAGIMYPELASKPSSSEPSSSQSGESSSAESTTSSEPPVSSSQVVSSQTSAGNPFPAGTIMKYGDKGDNVLKLQQRLKELGFMYGTPNGVFDDKTLQFVKDFQFTSKMVADGVADDDTLNALYAADAPRGPNP